MPGQQGQGKGHEGTEVTSHLSHGWWKGIAATNTSSIAVTLAVIHEPSLASQYTTQRIPYEDSVQLIGDDCTTVQYQWTIARRLEHILHVSALRHPPRVSRLVERRGAIEHVAHIIHVAHIPRV